MFHEMRYEDFKKITPEACAATQSHFKRTARRRVSKVLIFLDA